MRNNIEKVSPYMNLITKIHKKSDDWLKTCDL
jgi:hypothetical protein